MSTTFQSRDDSIQLDSTGSAVISFDGPIDRAFMTVQTPQTGAGSAIVGGTCAVVGPSSVKVRLWRSNDAPDQFSVEPAAGERVLINLLGTKG
jgi:hypothetical protein